MLSFTMAQSRWMLTPRLYIPVHTQIYLNIGLKCFKISYLFQEQVEKQFHLSGGKSSWHGHAVKWNFEH